MICPYNDSIYCPHIDTGAMVKLVDCRDCPEYKDYKDSGMVRATGGISLSGRNKKIQDDFEITNLRKKEYLTAHKPYIQFSLSLFCSHNCWYCISYPAFKGPKQGLIDRIGEDKYIDFLMSFTQGRVCAFRYNGHEPTEHPSFYRVLLRILEAGHDVEVITNGLLLCDIIDDRLLPYKDRIKWEMSCHLGVYREKSDDHRFVKWVRSFEVAQRYGRVHLIIPMTPDLLNGELDLSSFENVTFDLIEFYYTGKDRVYPRDYTEAEKSELLRLRNKYQGQTTAEEIEAITKINRVLYLKGVPCFYTSRIVNINYDGTYRLCGSGFPPKINSKYSFVDDADPCPYDSCNCIDLGRQHCLVPHGMTFNDYLPYHRPVKKKLISKIKRAIEKCYYGKLTGM